MSPRALDPLYRAREFPRMPSPRRQSRTQEQRLSRAERQIRAVANVATQPDAQSVAGTVYLLPPATLDDIGNTIVIHSSAGPGTQTYIGVLDPFGLPQWLLISSNDTGGSGSGSTIGGATFTADHQWSLSSLAPRTLAASSDGDLFIGIDNDDVRRLDPTTGTITRPVLGFPPTTTVRGISARTTGTGDIYVAGRTAKKLYRWNSGTSAIVTSSDTHTFTAVRYNASDGFVYSAYGTSAAGGALERRNANTLNLSATTATITSPSALVGLGVDAVSGDLLTTTYSGSGYIVVRRTVANVAVWGAGTNRAEITTAAGIAADSTFVYVADSGANKIRVYLLSTGVYQGSFGSSGSGLDQLSSPQDVAVDGSNIYIADFGNNRIIRWVKS